MQMPFTVDQFYEVFRDYNEAVWPVQFLLVMLGLAAIALVLRPRRWSSAAVSAILAVLWAWMAIAYHLIFFARINPLAYLFAGISLAGAAAFVWEGIVRRKLKFSWTGGVQGWTGAVLIAFAVVAYPAWSWFAGHRYPYMPTFGLPCPTTAYTIGLLAFLAAPHPRSPYIAPVVWSFIGAQAAFFLRVPQDLSLIVAGVVGIVLLVRARATQTWRGRSGDNDG